IVNILPIQRSLFLQKYSDTIYLLEYSPSGDHLLINDENGISIYDIHNIDAPLFLPYKGFPAFHPNQKTLLIFLASGDGIIAVDLKTKKVVWAQQFFKILQCATTLSFTAGQKRLAVSDDTIIIITENRYGIFAIPGDLQQFFRTYNPVTV